ncbi:---NA--- [Octopus vulgaris]|uniref:---NA n=1 Tax=Octopus vulgaris TaxID=6645 RepID=A0AA36F1M2_OCTVU|nr:---NA--- [Octopus vulgaris]
MQKRSYNCSFYCKSFSKESTLVTHSPNQTKEKPYCGKSFSYKREKPYHCDISSKSFSKTGSLMRYKCMLPGEKFIANLFDLVCLLLDELA